MYIVQLTTVLEYEDTADMVKAVYDYINAGHKVKVSKTEEVTEDDSSD